MHGDDGYAGVDDVHAVLGEDVGDGATAARADAAELAGLVIHACLVHDVADLGEVLGIGIVGAALTAGARVLVEAQTVAHDSGVLLLEVVGVEMVETGRDVGAEHAGVGECAAQGERGVLAGERHDLGDGVLEEAAGHAGGAHGADLLLVDEQGHARGLDLGRVELGAQGRVGADAVVLAVAQDHGAVEAHVAGGAGGYDLDLGGEEVLLLDVVLLLDEVEEHLLDGLLDLLVAFDDDGAAGNDDIEVLMVDRLAGGLLHLIACEVDQQVGDAEDRIGRVLAHGDVHGGAILLADDAVQRQRGGDPVVGLHTAVVVGVEVSHVAGLVQRILLEVEARGVDVGAQNVHAQLHRAAAQVDEHEGLVVTGGVDLVAGLERAAFGKGGLEAHVTGFLGELDAGGHALALGLVLADVTAVILAELVELGQGGVVVFLPGVRSLHDGTPIVLERVFSTFSIVPRLRANRHAGGCISRY